MLLKARHKSGGSDHESRLCVGTTHILYNPKRGDVKLAQLQVLLANIDRLAFRGSRLVGAKMVHEYNPIVLCGDFNCVNDSKLYEFVSAGRLDNYRELNRNVISGQYETSRCPIYIDEMLPKHLGISDQSQYLDEVDKRMSIALERNKSSLVSDADNYDVEIRANCSQGSEGLAHNFNLRSVYKHYNENGMPEVTTCVHDFKKTVDYIFYHSEKTESGANEENNNAFDDESSDELKLVGRLELFTVDKLSNIELPERNYSSDHFSLAAKFALEIK